MEANITNLKKSFGISGMSLFPDGKDVYLVIEQLLNGDMVIPNQTLNSGGRGKVLADLMMGHYERPVMIVRMKIDGTWRDVSSSFATFWFLKAVGENKHYSGTLPPFLAKYLHEEFRPDWLVNEAA